LADFCKKFGKSARLVRQPTGLLNKPNVEYAQIIAVVNEYAPQIVWGFADYDTVYPEFLRRLKNAGIDSYTAEYQRQFSAFYSGKR
jgi:hypothetical protein